MGRGGGLLRRVDAEVLRERIAAGAAQPQPRPVRQAHRVVAARSRQDGLHPVDADDGRAVDAEEARRVEALQARGAAQATTFPKDHRPWGWFESLVTGPRFQVKRILVHPGASLSLQSHFHRSEHWIVVEGTARVTRDDETRLVTENESIYLPLGCRHRMENPGKVPMVLIEVQTGTYVGEDDIIRYEDVYART